MNFTILNVLQLVMSIVEDSCSLIGMIAAQSLTQGTENEIHPSRILCFLLKYKN